MKIYIAYIMLALIEPRGMQKKGVLDNDRLTLFHQVDSIGPPQHMAELLEAGFAGRVSVVRLAKAGRAILQEQLERTASAVLDFAGLHLSR